MATFKGGPGKDELLGTHKEDLLQGLGGNDKLQGFEDEDVLDGGSGSDTASYRFSEFDSSGPGGVSVDLHEGQGSFGDAAGDTLVSVENLIGSDFDDFLDGSKQDNRIEGLEGNDYIYGFGGDDVLLAGDGNDQADGGAGDDRIRGGDGIDEVDGEVGEDNVDGGAGGDIVEGGVGDDIVNGGRGADTLFGGDDEDDLLDPGSDTFVFNTGLETFDTIGDFHSFSGITGEDDQIRLDSAIFTALSNGPLPETQYNENTSGTAEDATDRILYDTDSGELYYDPDGTGIAPPVQFALLTGAPALGFEDFFVA